VGQVHHRSHTGDRPYKCGFGGCSKSFVTSYALKSHRRVHTGERPYECTACGCAKAFKTSGDLQKHLRTHSGLWTDSLVSILIIIIISEVVQCHSIITGQVSARAPNNVQT